MISAGQVDAGIAKLKKLSDAQPENAQYRSMLKIQQQLQIASMLKAAEATNIKNDPEAAYKQVLALDPNNQRALEGLKKLSLTQNHDMMLANALAAIDRQDNDTARNLLRGILAEDANYQDARDLFEKIENKRIDKITVTPQIKSAFKKPITLELKKCCY